VSESIDMSEGTVGEVPWPRDAPILNWLAALEIGRLA
jgi:hypothetical protein